MQTFVIRYPYMCNSTLTLLLCLASSLVPLSAQTSGDELDSLRKHLGVSEGFQVGLAQDKSLPNGKIGVFLAFGLDTAMRDNLVRWIGDWNRKDGKKYGSIDLASELGQADVVLARYTISDRISSQTYTTPGTVVVYNPNTNQLESKAIARTYSTSMVPAYGYVLRRGENRLDVISRYTGAASAKTTKRSGQDLWDNFKDLMKQRATNSK
jgi:hypothetical protein